MKRNVFISISICALGLFLLWFVWNPRSDPNFQPTFVTQRSQEFKPAASTNSSGQILGYLAALIEDDHSPIPESVTKRITPAEKNQIMDRYKQTADLVEKARISQILRLIGGQDIVDLLKSTLSEDYTSKPLTIFEAKNGNTDLHSLSFIIVNLGLLATTNNDAYAFLKQGVYPEHWQKNIHWSSEDSGEKQFAFQRLASGCISAIAMTGRSDALEIITQLANEFGSRPDDAFHLGFVNAAFECYVTKKDPNYYNKLYRREISTDLEPWKAWEKTDDGKKWHTWNEAVKQAYFTIHPLPPPPTNPPQLRGGSIQDR
jgi:hypothetical protein